MRDRGQVMDAAAFDERASLLTDSGGGQMGVHGGRAVSERGGLARDRQRVREVRPCRRLPAGLRTSCTSSNATRSNGRGHWGPALVSARGRCATRPVSWTRWARVVALRCPRPGRPRPARDELELDVRDVLPRPRFRRSSSTVATTYSRASVTGGTWPSRSRGALRRGDSADHVGPAPEAISSPDREVHHRVVERGW